MAERREKDAPGDPAAGGRILAHGARELPGVIVESYNLELKDRGPGADPQGFLGDRASKRAFSRILDDLRAQMPESDVDPLGDTPSAQVGKKKLDAAIARGDVAEAGLVLAAIEAFAQELAKVISHFLRSKGWEGCQAIAVGGGLRGSRVGELAIGRAAVLLKTQGVQTELAPIAHDPDEAGLIGAAHLTPAWTLAGHDGFVAVDIGGANVRVGIVRPRFDLAPDLSRAQAWKTKLWRHADEKPSRKATLERLVDMARGLIERAEAEGLKLAPFVGVACPGLIAADGSISRGGQNLPGGNWHAERFNLPRSLALALPRIGGQGVCVLMHNDAVVQGLSQAPLMRGLTKWGAITIGTGLGNAAYSNRGEA